MVLLRPLDGLGVPLSPAEALKSIGQGRRSASFLDVSMPFQTWLISVFFPIFAAARCAFAPRAASLSRAELPFAHDALFASRVQTLFKLVARVREERHDKPDL
jgi:hypothetical protein